LTAIVTKGGTVGGRFRRIDIGGVGTFHRAIDDDIIYGDADADIEIGGAEVRVTNNHTIAGLGIAAIYLTGGMSSVILGNNSVALHDFQRDDRQ